MYEVNGEKFISYLAAVRAANAVRAEVFEVRENGERVRRWYPAPIRKPKSYGVIINADGTKTPFSKVRR